MSPVQLLRKNKLSFFLLLWMSVMPLLCSAIITYTVLQYEPYLRSFTHIQWALFYIGTIASMALALTPTTFVALVSGYFLSWQAVPFMLVAYLAASAVGYQLARLADQGRFLNAIKDLPKVNDLMHAVNQQSFTFIILCRISPILPFAIMNVVLSMMRVPFFQFIWAGFLGMLPRTLLFIWAGNTASALRETISGGQGNINQISFLILLTFSIVGFYFYFKRIITQKLQK